MGTPPTPPFFKRKKANSSTDDDSGIGAVAYTIIKAENNEVMKTIDPDQPIQEQELNWFTPLSITIANIIGAVRSSLLLKVLLDPNSTASFYTRHFKLWCP